MNLADIVGETTAVFRNIFESLKPEEDALIDCLFHEASTLCESTAALCDIYDKVVTHRKTTPWPNSLKASQLNFSPDRLSKLRMAKENCIRAHYNLMNLERASPEQVLLDAASRLKDDDDDEIRRTAGRLSQLIYAKKAKNALGV